MRASILAVLASGLGFAVLGAGIFGFRAGLGVLIGASIATANLWVFSRLGEAFIYNDAIVGIRGDTQRLREIEAALLGA